MVSKCAVKVGRNGTDTAILSLVDGGLAKTTKLQFAEDGGSGGYVQMGIGGVLAVLGDKTTNPFLPKGLFSLNTAIDAYNGLYRFGEIRYHNGTSWVNMNGAAVENTDFTIEYVTTSTIINGQDVNGYTVLTMLVPPPAGTVIMFK